MDTGKAFVPCSAVFFLMVLFMVPTSSHAQVSCTGLGDNLITVGGGGVSVACSKYETPGGGDTKFQTPDGTLCSFGNTATDKITCGKKGDESVKPKPVSQAQFNDIVRASLTANHLGTDLEDLGNQIQQIIGGTALDGSSYLDSSFDEDGEGLSAESAGASQVIGPDPFVLLLSIIGADEAQVTLEAEGEEQDVFSFEIPTVSGAFMLRPGATSTAKASTTTRYTTTVRRSAVTIPAGGSVSKKYVEEKEPTIFEKVIRWVKEHIVELLPLALAVVIILLLLLREWLSTKMILPEERLDL